MWRCEWIWQTYGWVMVTSIALGLVTTIFWCSSRCCLLVLVKIRLILADDVSFHLLGAHANVIKIGGSFRRVERPKDIRPPSSTTPARRRCNARRAASGLVNGSPLWRRRSDSSRKLPHDSWQATDPSSRSNRTGARVHVAQALSARTTCGEQPAAGEPGRSRAGRPLMARRKGRALSSTTQRALRRSQKGEGDTLRRRDLRESERGGRNKPHTWQPARLKIVFLKFAIRPRSKP